MIYKYQYMVDCTLPKHLTQDFLELIPLQREIVNKLFLEGKLVSYALSIENSHLWAIFNADSEEELFTTVSLLPLMDFMTPEVSPLTFYNSIQRYVPEFSYN